MTATTKREPKGKGKKQPPKALKRTQKSLRRFGSLMVDTSRSLIGGGQRRVNRRSNRTVSGRFLNDMITIAETTHLAGSRVDLSKILIEPRFLPEPEIIQPIAEDDVLQEVYYVLPRMSDLPHILGPYNPPTFRIPQLAVGNRRLAILGESGSGRTTALMAIALWVMQEIEFSEKDDPVKELLAAKEAELSDKDREELQRQREKMKKEAKEQLEMAIESGSVGEASRAVTAAEAYAEDQKSGEELPAFNTLTPIYIHCADLNVSAAEFSTQVDPAEPLIRAVQMRVGSLTARTIPRTIYQRLEQNRMLILMDGYDDLPEAERRYVEGWLFAFVQQYGNNFIIMTGPAVGYGKLSALGMTPLFIKPWNPREIDECIEKWATAWPEATASRRQEGTTVSRNQRRRTEINNHGLSPAQLTLKIWASFADDTSKPNIDDWIQVFFDNSLPDGYTFNDILPLLKIAATLQINQGFITRKTIEQVLEQQERVGSQNIDVDSLEGLRAEAVEESEDEEDDEDEEQAKRRRIINELVFSGMLVRFRGSRYRFRHQIFADYLASLTLQPLVADDPTTLYNLAKAPNWASAFRYAVLHTNLDNVVKMKLADHEDILRSNLIELTRWLGFTKEEPRWRNEILSRLGNAFIHPNQFVSNRERIAAALIASRDHKGAIRIFEFGVQNPNTDVRRISCIGIGALGKYGQRLTQSLSAATLDPQQDVQIAAALALAAIRTDEAKLALVEAFLDGEERLQQAAAEEFAAMPDGGYMTLYEAVEHQEMHVRRAALFGVRRIETDWASEVVRQTFLNESEWFVRVVAQEAFIKEQAGLVGPAKPITPDNIEWIRNWAIARDIDLPEGNKSRRVLVRSLEDPNPEIQAYGAIALGQMGIVQAVERLYHKLGDANPIVRDAAHKGLVEIELQMGANLPDPM
jgi:HEAT repeat protein